jgi:hypothetical protein
MKTTRWAAVSYVTFAIAGALVAGCGHQVTPNPVADDLSGEILVRLRTSAPLDFNLFTYVIAVDTCGSGVPYPQPNLMATTSYTYGSFIGANFNTAYPLY